MSKIHIIVVTGPTASGKTAFGLRLAEALGGEIVSADSMQVYRYLDIGTAKPTPEERRRVAHHLIDVADPDETYHAGRFEREARRAIRDIARRGRVPIVAGGTALYLKVLLEGLAAGPGRDERVRRELETRWDAGEARSLWQELRAADPELASRLHPNDRTRVVRGLEVWRVAGEKLSALQGRHRLSDRPYDSLRLGLDVARPELYARIDRRVLEMMEAGWVAEVQRVLAMGYLPQSPPLQAIGYREICAYLDRGGEFPSVVATIQRETRRLAKRQMTWFNRTDLEWVGPAAMGSALERAKKFLQTAGAPL